MSGSPEYSTWIAMRKRCYYHKTNDYQRYGGAGIKVCDEWRSSFETFYRDMGPRPSMSHSIDRLDPTKNYEPTNCRWATSKEQCETRSKWNPPKLLSRKVCIECSKEFKRSEYDISRFGGKFCSNSCARKADRRKFVEAGHKLVELTCVCGKKFMRTPYQVARRKTMSCSFKCRSALKSQTHSLSKAIRLNTSPVMDLSGQSGQTS